MLSWLIIIGLAMPVHAGKRSKKKAEAATQDATDVQDSSCASDVGCVGNKGPKPEIICRTNTRHKGTLVDPRNGLELDLSRATSGLRLEHKLDIDAHEDRCITDVWIDAQHEDSGCALTLHYKANPRYNGRPGSERYVLVSGSFIADSFCPGWDDAVEGRYRWTPKSSAPNLVLTKDQIDERTERESCVSISAQLDGRLRGRKLVGSGVELDVSAFSVSGTFPSVGDTRGVCAGTPEPGISGALNSVFVFYSGYSFPETDDVDEVNARRVGLMYSRSFGPKVALYGALGFLSSDDWSEEHDFRHLAVGAQVFVWGNYQTMGAFADLELGRTSSTFEKYGYEEYKTTMNTVAGKLGFRYVSEYDVVVELKLGVPYWMVSSSIIDTEDDYVYAETDDTMSGFETMLAIGYTF